MRVTNFLPQSVVTEHFMVEAGDGHFFAGDSLAGTGRVDDAGVGDLLAATAISGK